MVDRYRIALAQLNPVVGDIAGNLARARAARAGAMDADVILFSELFIVGYSPEDLVLKPALQEGARAAVEELARDTADGGPAILMGSPWALHGELFNAVAKIKITHIPYKSTGLAIYATTSGEVMVGFGGIFAAKGLADTGKLRPLAIASATRSDVMPKVPTFAESGWPQIDGTSHRGIITPAATPRDVITRMNAAINKVLLMPAVRARMTEVGYVVTGGSPEDFGRSIRSEMDKWAKILRDANIKVE